MKPLALCAMPSGMPGSPGNTRPSGAVGNTTDCAPGMNPFSRFCASVIGLMRS